MRKLVGRLVFIGVVGAAGYAAYTFMLNDDAKAKLKAAAKTVGDAATKVADIVAAAQGTTMADDGIKANVQATQQQWAAMGY